jgi:hypothetical protein
MKLRHLARLLLIGGMLWGSGPGFTAGSAQSAAPAQQPDAQRVADAPPSIASESITLRFDAADARALNTQLELLRRSGAIERYAIDPATRAAHVIGRIDALIDLQVRFDRTDRPIDAPHAAPARRPVSRPAPNSALADGSITGSIKGDDTSAPLEGAYACAYQLSPYIYVCGYADANGVYTITLPPGAYTVQAFPIDYHIGEYYDNVTNANSQAATVVAVSDGATTPNINFGLAAGVQIAGRVTNAATGAGVPNVGISADSNSDNAYATTDASGFYTTSPGLPAGAYTVRFLPSTASGLAIQYYNNADRVGASTPVVLTSGVRGGIDAALRAAAVITGAITGPGGVPVASSFVQLFDADEAYVTGVSANATGVYTLRGVPAGAYKLQFRGNGPLLGEWHNNKRTLGEADLIALTAGVTTTINAELAAGATMTGRVTDRDTGAGLPGVNVSLNALDGVGRANAQTDATGYYTATGAETGDYRVYFGAPAPYVSESFDNAVSFVQYTPVSLSAGVTTTNINASLGAGPEITGTVTGPGGAPLAGVYVCAHAIGDLNASRCASTDAAGQYRAGPLTPGAYQIYAQGDSQYAQRWYDGALNTDTAQRVTMGNSTVPNINIALVPGAAISGRVSNASNAGVAGVQISIYPRNSNGVIRYATTGADGAYSAKALAPGVYQVEFAPPGGARQWYNGAPGQFESTVITVTGTTAVTGINARLDAAASGTAAITGTITTAGGARVSNTSVYCQNIALQATTYVFAVNGAFTCADLAPGSYIVYAYPPAPYPSFVYYPAASTQSAAQRITVTNGVTTPITFVLQTAGGISGQVTVSGVPKAGVAVNTYPRSGESGATAQTLTNSAGRYAIGRLPAGSYTVFFGSGPAYNFEYYDNALVSTNASTVSVASGAVTPNINADLATGGVIKGVVTAADTGRPIPTAALYAYSADGAKSYYFTADADGKFVSPGLPAGNYVLLAIPGSYGLGYASEYFNNAASFAGATQLTVGAPGSETTANVALDPGGSISGKTIDASTGLPVGGVYVQSTFSGTLIYASTTSDAYGNYRLSGLRVGEHILYYSRTPFTDLYYDRTTDFRQVVPIVLTVAGSDVPNTTLRLVRIRTAYLPVIRK